MIVCLKLFWIFFKIGLFTFGGGYAMIPLIEQEIVPKWLAEDALYNYIGISEATPGPFAVNIATFVGASQQGFLGALCATIGVVLPSFIIILLVAAIFKKFAQNKYVVGTLKGVAPVVCALVIGTGLLLIVKNLVLNFGQWQQKPIFDFLSLAIAASAVIVCLLYKKMTKKALSPVWVIIMCAGLGMVLYST